MALKDIIARIEAEAQAQSESIVAKAKHRCAEIVEAGKSDALAEARTIVAKAKQLAQSQTSHVLTLARLDGRRQVLEAKQKVLSGAFDSALQRLSDLDDQSYLNLLKQAVMANTVRGDELLSVNARDHERITAGFLQQLNAELKAQGLAGTIALAEDRVAISGGCILKGEELEVNASFDSVLKTVRDELEPQIAGHLFDNRS